MIIVVAALLAVLSVPLSGVSLRPLGKLPLHRPWLVWLSILAQMLITLVSALPHMLSSLLHVGTFGFAAAFMWSNRHICGSWLIAVGAAMNLAAIVANGGTMPASEWAWNTAGFAEMTGFENSNVTADATLWFFGDILAIPKTWPLSNVFSIGDIVIVIGVGYFAHVTCRRAKLGVLVPESIAAQLATV